MAAFQILHCCPNCLIDGVLIESYEEGMETFSSFSCSFCGYEEGHSSGFVFTDLDQTRDLLHKWIIKEGGTDINHFCEMNFCGLTEEEVLSRLLQKKTIESSFDVLEYLFPGFAGGGLSITTEIEEEYWEDPLPTEEAYTYIPDKNIPVEARALAAVMLADGSLKEQEEELINQTLMLDGLSCLQDKDKHGWMPMDLPIPSDPEDLILKMLDVAFVDHDLDESEWRVIKEFARYWGCDRKKLNAEREKRIGPPKSFMFRMWNAIKILLFQENV
jgi:hypothetical protein